MSSLLQMFFDDSSSDDDDDFFDMAAILLTGIAMNEQSKHGGSVPPEVVHRKLFDDYYSTDDESTAMSCANSGTIALSAARKKPLPLRLDGSAGSRLSTRRPRTRGGLMPAGGEDGVPVMDLSAGEAPMARRQKRKASEVQAGRSSAEEEVGTEDGLDPVAPAGRLEANPNPKYLGPDQTSVLKHAIKIHQACK